MPYVSLAQDRVPAQVSDTYLSRNWSSYAAVNRLKYSKVPSVTLKTPTLNGADPGAQNGPFQPDGIAVASSRDAEFSLIINGRLHIDYWGFLREDAGIETLEDGDPQSRVGFRRIRVSAKGAVRWHIIYKIEIEFASPDNTEWRDAFIGFRRIPLIQKIIVGNQKRPYGLDHLNSSRYNVFLERPMFIDAFNDDTRRLGTVIYGINSSKTMNWMLGGYSGDKVQDEAAFYKSEQFQGEVAGRFAHTPYYDKGSDGRTYVHWAISGTVAFPDGRGGEGVSNTAHFRARPEARSDNRWIDTGAIADATNYQLVGLENVINIKRFQFVTEAQHTWVQREGKRDLRFWGAYAYLSLFLTDDYMSWNRKTGTLGRIKPSRNLVLQDDEGSQNTGPGAWQLQCALNDPMDRRSGGVAQSLTVGLNWYFNAFSRLQLNYLRGQISRSDALNASEEGAGEATYDILGARLMVDF